MEEFYPSSEFFQSMMNPFRSHSFKHYSLHSGERDERGQRSRAHSWTGESQLLRESWWGRDDGQTVTPVTNRTQSTQRKTLSELHVGTWHTLAVNRSSTVPERSPIRAESTQINTLMMKQQQTHPNTRTDPLMECIRMAQLRRFY